MAYLREKLPPLIEHGFIRRASATLLKTCHRQRYTGNAGIERSRSRMDEATGWKPIHHIPTRCPRLLSLQPEELLLIGQQAQATDIAAIGG